jgi:hypothetical protein
MKREDITKIFGDATKEQIDQIMAIYGADIEAAKATGTAAAEELKTAKETIAALEAAKGNADELAKELDRYKAEEQARKAEEEAAKAHAAIESRFTAVTGGKAFVHDYVRSGVLGEFEKALADETNTGKSDAEIFDALTKDKDYFKSQNPGSVGGMGKPGSVDIDAASMAAARKIMGLPADK